MLELPVSETKTSQKKFNYLFRQKKTFLKKKLLLKVELFLSYLQNFSL